MQYALLLKSHANVRYVQSLQKLSVKECDCLLSAAKVAAEVCLEEIEGTMFLTVTGPELEEKAWKLLSLHSGVAFAARREGSLLAPLRLSKPDGLGDDLPQVLKYKGKTNADFTAMMLHCALSASAFADCEAPLTVLDPICGRGTTLFCALTEGHNAIGIETDAVALRESEQYFERYLQFHRLKHRQEKRSLTLPHGGSAAELSYTFALTPEAYKDGDTRTLRLIHGDTLRAAEMLRPNSCHLVLGDLPYGVQHAPKEGRGISTMERLLGSALPGYLRALKPGGAIALAFNTYTLPRRTVCEQMAAAGFRPLTEPPYDDFAHWVEQAVNRDFVVAVKAK